MGEDSWCLCIGLAQIAMNEANLVFEEKGCQRKSLQMLKLEQADHSVTEGALYGGWNGRGI